MLNSNKPCPCCSGKRYGACCQPVHLNKQAAQTAEQLMRSRFSAFGLGLTQYLLQSWCDTTRPADLDLTDQPQWTRLEIHRTQGGGPDQQAGLVEFSAYYLDGLYQGELREISQFQRNSAGKWCYIDGQILAGV